MIGGGPSAETTKRRLEVASAIADALLERATLDATPAWAERARGALALLEDSEVPTAVFDLATPTPRLVNRAWRALFGASCPYDAIPRVDDLRSGAPLHFPELRVDVAGRPACCAVTLRSSRDHTGATTGMIVVCLDITDEIFARELAVDADALVWSGPCGREADYFNRRWSGSVASQAAWREAIHPDDLAKCTQGLDRAVRERGATELEARLRGSNGDYRWHRIRFAVARSGPRWFGAASDIDDARSAATERDDLLALERAARARAEEANHLKDQFIATVSHELRTPLTTMVLWETILRDESADAPTRARALDAIRQSVVVQSRIVGDLLDISRAVSGKLHVDLRPVEIEDVLRGALETIAPLALAKQVVVERRGAEVGAVSGDAVRLGQVFSNLLSNAVHVTEPGGRITVAASQRGSAIVIEVEDTGCGIPAEFLPRMFEPFSQIDDAMTRSGPGLGLGLAISRRLVELQRGTLTAASPGPGRGATFTVTLQAVPRSTKAAAPRNAPALGRARVLVIDDDQRVCEALLVLFRGAGVEIETADSATAGRERIARRPPDALICDIAMPGEDGYTFIRTLRASGNHVAAIALTAHATESDVGRALAAGFDRHLAKPVDFESLLVSIDELVAVRRAAPSPQ